MAPAHHAIYPNPQIANPPIIKYSIKFPYFKIRNDNDLLDHHR